MDECKRIYVVEDDELVAETLSLILQQSGYATTTYGDAESAFREIRQSAPDLVISDVLLSGEMTGLQLANKIAESSPAIKIMLMSGLANLSGRTDRPLLSSTSFRVHAKPISPRWLLGEVARVLAAQYAAASVCSLHFESDPW